eukprot:9505341-Ditylum_brightwellii.AAC.1
MSGPTIKLVFSGGEVSFGYIPPAAGTVYKDKNNKKSIKKNVATDISIRGTIKKIRYCLRTLYEDVWRHTKEETGLHIGNTLSYEGFMGVSMKDMETDHHPNISKLWTQKLNEIYARSNATLDNKKNIRIKQFGLHGRISALQNNKISTFHHAMPESFVIPPQSLKFGCTTVFLWCESLDGIEADLTGSGCLYPVLGVINANYVGKERGSTRLNIGKVVDA